MIQTETEATEDRIDRYKKQQMATLKAFREKAEQDFYDILRYALITEFLCFFSGFLLFVWQTKIKC